MCTGFTKKTSLSIENCDIRLNYNKLKHVCVLNLKVKGTKGEVVVGWGPWLGGGVDGFKKEKI